MSNTHIFFKLNPDGKFNSKTGRTTTPPTSFSDVGSGIQLVNKQIGKAPIGQVRYKGSAVAEALTSGYLVMATEEEFDNSMESVEFHGRGSDTPPTVYSRGNLTPTAEEQSFNSAKGNRPPAAVAPNEETTIIDEDEQDATEPSEDDEDDDTDSTTKKGRRGSKK